MKKKKVWRYYCEFCKKSGCNGWHLKIHEDGCTNNPNRSCGMCRVAGLDQQPMKSLVWSLGDGDKDGLEKLRELANNCPACILSAIRQSGVQSAMDEEGNGFSVDFNFEEEKKYFWEEINESKTYNCHISEL